MTLLVPFVPWVKWGLSFPQVSFLCDSQFKAPLESICTVLHFLYDFVFSTNREMKSGSGSVKATKQSAQWAKSTAGQGCLWGSPWMHAPYFQQVEDWKKKKKPNITLHFALFFFPFSTLTKKICDSWFSFHACGSQDKLILCTVELHGNEGGEMRYFFSSCSGLL